MNHLIHVSGMCGMQQGGPSFGAVPMNMCTPNTIPDASARAAVGSGDGSSKTSDGRLPMQATGC